MCSKHSPSSVMIELKKEPLKGAKPPILQCKVGPVFTIQLVDVEEVTVVSEVWWLTPSRLYSVSDVVDGWSWSEQPGGRGS